MNSKPSSETATMNHRITLATAVTVLLLNAAHLKAEVAAEATATQAIELAGGKLAFDAPKEWQTVPPKSRILEKELHVLPAPGSEATYGRLTIMAAGGSVRANLDRWVGQFQTTDGEAKPEKMEVNGMPAHLLDVSGTYLESAGGPFGPKTPRPGYRMLGAIVETGDSGNYFFKLVGPNETLDPQADAFRAMVESLRTK